MNSNRTILPGLVLILALCTSSLLAQSTWSLPRCVDHARQNSLTIKQNLLAIARADVALTKAKHNVYPNLSASTNIRTNFGRTIDPTTNDFENTSISQNSIGFSGGMTLFNGGAIRNLITQSKINLESSKLDAQQFSDDLALTVVQYYIAILFAQERLDNARITLQTTTQQLQQIDRLITAGSRPEADRLDIVAQQARDEQNIISFENTVNSNKLLLKQLLQLPLDQTFEIENPGPNVLQPSAVESSLASIYDYAAGNRSDIKSGDLKIKSAELGVKIQKGQYLPSVSLGGNLNTLFSSLGRKVTGFTTRVDVLDVQFNGQNAKINVLNQVPTTAKNPYFSQLDQNLGYGVGVGVSIPIYSNYTTTQQVRNAELSVESARLTNEQTKQTLRNNIQTALNEVNATRNAYAAAQRSREAQQKAYDNMKTRFDLGSANTFDLVSSKNRLDIAIVEELITRYDYIFRTKIIDYYMGRPITL